MSENQSASQSPTIGGHQAIADQVVALSLAWIHTHVEMLASCVRHQQAEEGFLESGALLSAGNVVGRAGGADVHRYLDALKAEQDDAEKAEALLAEIAATPAQSLAGVVAKLAVVVREADDNSDLYEFPLPQIRSALADLRRLTNGVIGDEFGGWPHGEHSICSLLEQPASSFAAWRAFSAWSQGDEEAYRAWTQTFKTLKGASQ